MAIDILILAIVVVGGIIGFSKGIISQIGQIAALVAGIIAARIAGDTVAAAIAGSGDISTLDYVSGYGLVFLAAYCLVWLVARMIHKVFHAVHLGIIDRLAGAAFKIAQWALMLSLALNFYLLIAGDDDRLHAPESPWREAVLSFAPATLGYLDGLIQNNKAAKGVNPQNDKDESDR